MRVARSLMVALLVAVGTAGCSDDGDTAAPTTTAPEATTTTTGAPIVLGVVRPLDLQVGQCYAPIPAPPDPTTTTTATTTPAAAPPADTETETETTVATTTTTTEAPSMIVADCAGPHLGQVYGSFCLVRDAAGLLAPAECPGPADDPWPGDREVRRAAVRLCLALFEQQFGEPYATSDRSTAELTPTEGVWHTGDHRVVCTATEPATPPVSSG